jgi:small-conductance mechanosensitive channel
MRAMTDSDRRPVGERSRLRVGLIGVVLTIVAVFAAFNFALYTLQTVFGISFPYPEITISLTWALIALIGTLVLGHTIEVTTSQFIGRANASSLRKVVTVVLILVIVFDILSKLGIDLSGYVVSLGITAVVIGFAAQATIGNLIAGMLVLVSKPFRKGDYVRVNITGAPIEGRLEEINFFRSRVVTNDGVSISVPNTVMLAVPISNFTVFEKRPIILNVTLSRRVSLDRFRNKIEAAMLGNGESMGEIRLYMKGLDRDSMTVELWAQVATHNFLKERSLIVRRIIEICQRENIQLEKIGLQG